MDSTSSGSYERPRDNAGESAWLAVGFLVQAGVLLVYGAAILIFSSYPLLPWLLLAAGCLSLATLVVLAFAAARSTDLKWGKVVVYAQLGVQLALALGLGAITLYQAIKVSALGPNDGAWWVLVGIALTGLLLIGCCRVLMRRKAAWITPSLRRIISVTSVVLVGALLCAGLASATLQSKPLACSLFSLDRESWADASSREKQRIGETLVRCDTMSGKSAGEVKEMFGSETRVRKLYLGWVNDALGPGDEQFLTITYDRGDRVSSVRLAYPAD